MENIQMNFFLIHEENKNKIKVKTWLPLVCFELDNEHFLLFEKKIQIP